LAEAAVHRRGLEEPLEPYRDTEKAAVVHLDAIDGSWDVSEAVRATTSDTENAFSEVHEDEAITHRALDVLGSRRNDAYEAALAALREGTQEWWAEFLARKPDELDEQAKATLALIEQ
jgi:hypothetical protein